MSYKEPAYNIIENDPETVKIYMKLIPKHELEGKTEKEQFELGQKKMMEYRIGRPNYGGKRKTRKRQKGKGIGNSKPIKPSTPQTKTRKSVQFSPSKKSPSSPKQNKIKNMFISKNKKKSKAVVQYENRQRKQDLVDMMLGKIPLEGGKKRRWSQKYKKSINCKKPKGFSQKQYCKGMKNKHTMKRKKN